MGKAIGIATGIVLLLAGIGFERSDYALHAYGQPGVTQNGGLVVGDCYHWNAGFELWGSPGPFRLYRNEC